MIHILTNWINWLTLTHLFTVQLHRCQLTQWQVIWPKIRVYSNKLPHLIHVCFRLEVFEAMIRLAWEATLEEHLAQLLRSQLIPLFNLWMVNLILLTAAPLLLASSHPESLYLYKSQAILVTFPMWPINITGLEYNVIKWRK